MFVWSSLKKVFAGYIDFKAKTDPREFFFGLAWLIVIQVAYHLLRGIVFDANGQILKWRLHNSKPFSCC